MARVLPRPLRGAGLLAALALGAAAPARALELPPLPLVPGLPPISNIVSVPGLPSAPRVVALPSGPLPSLLGLPGRDRLTVTRAAGGALLGLEGGDRLIGGPGPDRLDGGTGPDRAFGNDGDDLLKGGSGGDFLYGGNGGDQLLAGYGADVLDGGAGNDIVHALTNGRGTIDCGPGYDTVFTGHKRPRLRGCENVVNRFTTKRRGILR